MTNTIKCKKCGEEIEVSEALTHQIETEVLAALKVDHQKELDDVKRESLEIAKKDHAKNLQDKESEIESLRKRAEEAEAIELQVRKEKRDLEESRRKFEIEKQRQLDEERSKIRDAVLKESQESHELKDREKEKLINDLKLALSEAQRKAQQGSQQTQGEVMELELEEVLRKEFPDDSISEVKKGQRGADLVQKVFDKKGQECGTILWESKNAKWTEGWLAKLREDQRQAKAHLAVLVSENTPEGIETFTYRDGIWITNRKFAVGLALALRFDLIHIHYEKLNSVGKNEKMETLYQYLTGNEFRHRIESIAESFTNLQDDIEREKRWFNTKWARQEKELRKIVDSTQGMYGELQAVTGRALQQIKTLELADGEDE